MDCSSFRTAWLEPGASGARQARGAPVRRLDVAIERHGLPTARLVLARRAAHVTLQACDLEDQLLVASFFRSIPEVAAERAGTVVVRHPYTSVLDYRAFSAEIALATGVDWSLEGEGGQADMVLDLRAARLASVDLRGGQLDLTLKLPRPDRTVRVALEGGAFGVNVIHPPGVAVDLRVAGGIDDSTFEGRRVEATDAELRLRAGHGSAGHVITVTGGATRLRIDSCP